MNEPQPFPPSVPAPQRSGLSITSLVLGILSMPCLFGILTGIPAIITGHIARSHARREPLIYGGAGLALAGLILGYVSLGTLPIMAALLLPALAKAKQRAQTINCVSNMKVLALDARLWATDHKDAFPPDFLSMSNELVSPKILVCIGDKTKTKAMDWSSFDPSQNVTYEFVAPSLKEPDPAVAAQTVIIRCPIHGNEAMADGSVHQRPGSRRR